MMYTTVAEFAAKEAELSERLMKIGLMHDMPIMSLGDKPNLKSRMKFLAFVPRNSEQGFEGCGRADARAKLRGIQRNSLDKTKSTLRGTNQTKGKRKSGKSGKTKTSDKDMVPAKSSGADQSRTLNKLNHHFIKNEGFGTTAAKLKGRGEKQRQKAQEGSDRHPIDDKKSSLEVCRTKQQHSQQSDTQTKKIRYSELLRRIYKRRTALRSSRSLDCEAIGIGNDEKLKNNHASEELHGDEKTGNEKLHKFPLRNLKRSFSSAELGTPITNKKDRKGKRKGKARFTFKKRISSEDLDLEEELTQIMKDVESLNEEFEDGGKSSTPKESPKKEVSPIHDVHKLTQSEEDRIRFNAAFIRHLDESELEECLVGPVPDCATSLFPENVVKGNREHFTAVRECFHIYQTLEGRGFRIPLKTLHRGLMTPTEMRILEEIRKSSKTLMDVNSVTTNESSESKVC